MRGFLKDQVGEEHEREQSQNQQIDLSERRGEKRMMKMMKRKELDVDDVSDDLHDFSLSSPARKIRRLNALLPPIMEEEREQDLFGLESSPNSIPDDNKVVSVSDDPVNLNEEKAIVLYKPFLQPSSPSPNVSVSLDLISGFKSQFLRASHSGNAKLAEDEECSRDKNDATASNGLAVVPWVPSHFQLPPTSAIDTFQTEATELMEADDMGEGTMDIEENNYPSTDQGNAYELGGMRDNNGLNQWQQQHCMMPPPPQSTSTAITWFQ